MVSRGDHVPSQRQLRVAEQMRHLLAEQLLRGDLRDPRLAGRSLTVAEVTAGDTLAVAVTPSKATKCERCWHWRDDVGHDAAHPGLCGRCTSNLFGAGEVRRIA